MINSFWKLVPSSERALFGILGSGQSPQAGAPLSNISPSELLDRSGYSSLVDVVRTREEAKLFKLGSVDPDTGEPSLVQERLTGEVRDFFRGSRFSTDDQDRPNLRVKRPPEYRFDIREIGSAHAEDSSGEIAIFCCRYGEELAPLKDPTEEYAWAPSGDADQTIRLAIPSSAGLKMPGAASLLHPLDMFPHEYFADGDAGAFFFLDRSSGTVTNELYWSDDAFMNSLDRVQKIGTSLIVGKALPEAARTGHGIRHVDLASAILTKVYEVVAQVGQAADVPFVNSGVWGVAILPQRRGPFLCQIGIVAEELKSNPSEQATDWKAQFLSLGFEHKFVVANLLLERNDFGMLRIEPQQVNRFPVGDLPWHERLPNLI